MTRAAGLLVLPLMLSNSGFGEDANRPQKLCDEIVSTVYSRWLSRIPRERLRRVEVRNCKVGGWGFLQIAAWAEAASAPGLLVDTKRSTIVKIAMAGDVFVLETAGASSNIVQVVVFENGKPRLALENAIKAFAHVDMSWKTVRVGLPQREGPERIWEFPTGEN